MLIVVGSVLVLLGVLGLHHLDWSVRGMVKLSSINPWITRVHRWRDYVRFVTIAVLSISSMIGFVWLAVGIWEATR